MVKYTHTNTDLLLMIRLQSTMYVSKTIEAGHEDLIHDVAYDFYGKRMATCSSDQHVKVGKHWII